MTAEQEKLARDLLNEIYQLGLTPHYWEGELHNLTSKDLTRTAGLRARLMEHRATLLELEAEPEKSCLPVPNDSVWYSLGLAQKPGTATKLG